VPESNEERDNRELIELLNELRVAFPGGKVLFAFLLAGASFLVLRYGLPLG